MPWCAPHTAHTWQLLSHIDCQQQHEYVHLEPPAVYVPPTTLANATSWKAFFCRVDGDGVVCLFGFQHLFPPGPVLHISNITAGEAASEMIETLLKQHCVGGLAEPLRFFEQVHASLWASGLVAC